MLPAIDGVNGRRKIAQGRIKTSGGPPLCRDRGKGKEDPMDLFILNMENGTGHGGPWDLKKILNYKKKNYCFSSHFPV